MEHSKDLLPSEWNPDNDNRKPMWRFEDLKLALLLFALVPSVTTAQILSGKVVGITDSDTLTLLMDSTQHKIRLAEIDTPEKGQDWGNRARQALAEKVFQKNVRVDVSDTDRYGRLIGKIWLGDRDINREMVREGHAWVYRQYMTDDSLLEDEAAAKEQGIGLWGIAGPVAPWEWRRGGRKSTLSGEAFTCGSKRYCRDMTSCEEAKFYLQKCGLTRLDGDSDGVPCESICR